MVAWWGSTYIARYVDLRYVGWEGIGDFGDWSNLEGSSNHNDKINLFPVVTCETLVESGGKVFPEKCDVRLTKSK